MILASGLSKHFQDKKRGLVKAVDQADFECRPGEIFGLLGLNGAGKTTTLRLLSTTLKPTSGTASVAGYDIVREPEKVKSKIGFLTGNTALYPRLTADEVITFFAKLQGMTDGNIEERKREVFELLGIDSFRDTKIDKLSTGMKQKVSIARTIIHNPPVLVLDEPTVGLDVITSRAIIELIKSAKQQGKTVIFSTHRMEEAAKLCDRIAIIHNGKIAATGTLAELQKQTGLSDLEDIFVKLAGE
ncbi:MAG: ABC transporter ATP-binding protein [candidate division Zixibacteria bacterium RBG_16_50_21]|nr:MAG: ABC transporter ATP-binding protein [candidate division Zixibacteria bacterium RBG_16_50_21]